MRVFVKTIITAKIMPMTSKEVKISKEKVEVNVEEECEQCTFCQFYLVVPFTFEVKIVLTLTNLLINDKPSTKVLVIAEVFWLNTRFLASTDKISHCNLKNLVGGLKYFLKITCGITC